MYTLTHVLAILFLSCIAIVATANGGDSKTPKETYLDELIRAQDLGFADATGTIVVGRKAAFENVMMFFEDNDRKNSIDHGSIHAAHLVTANTLLLIRAIKPPAELMKFHQEEIERVATLSEVYRLLSMSMKTKSENLIKPEDSRVLDARRIIEAVKAQSNDAWKSIGASAK